MDDWFQLVRSVIDEIHEYRGYFGTNCALLLRRFLKMLDRFGNRPQLFLASATCANPEEHAFKLTGRKCTLIKSENNMRPERQFAFINPSSIPDFMFQDIFQLRIANAALACLSKELTTLVFCPSRKFTEDVLSKAKREANMHGYDPEFIISYRSGYTVEERREIEEGLRTGKYKIVFSTNALELGIDVGRLDVCVLAGFPDSIMSAWQRIGRAGRSMEKTAYVLFYAMNNAVDQFYAANLDAFLNKSLDQITIGLDNEELIEQHIRYLLHENSWEIQESDKNILGESFTIKAIERANAAAGPIQGYGPNYQRLSLRGGSHTIMKLKCNNQEIGSISDTQAFREAYVGAIYNHCGKAYRVESHGANEINLVDVDQNLRTIPSFHTVTQDFDLFQANRYDEKISLYYGKLTVFENFTGYRLENRDGVVIDEVQENLAKTRNSHAFWLIIEDESVLPQILRNGIKALEQLIRLGSMFVIPSDRHDICTLCKDAPQFTVYLYENVPGGIGIAEKAYTVWQDAIREGIKIAEQCDCMDGCPRCIFPPRLRDTHGMSKCSGIDLATKILNFTSNPPTETFDPNTHGWISRS